MLREVSGVARDRIAVVPHGIPETPFSEPDLHKKALDAEGRTVLLTFGLLSPGKGIEHAIRALPAIVARRPDAFYVVLGATHPTLRRREGEAYRSGLVRLAEELGVAAHVRFLDQFVDLPTLTHAIAAADIYLTPYSNEAQSVSGTLAYSFGMGKPVVSTPYWHAAELLADGRGVLVPFADPSAIAEAVLGLLEDPSRMRAMREAAYGLGRDFIWPRVGERYLELFRRARRETSIHRAATGPAARRDARPEARQPDAAARLRRGRPTRDPHRGRPIPRQIGDAAAARKPDGTGAGGTGTLRSHGCFRPARVERRGETASSWSRQ
jgi:glycosyltransferase involved in cell wall biosynthesis